jgi:catechol 2,3-dioxygenase-like lactoylglutathione lyase family enzyme
MARITGIGGVFFKARDPKALSAWYRDVLGLSVEDWGGVMFQASADGPPMTLFVPFEASSNHFDPSTREFMINFTVDDLDALLAMLQTKGIAPLKRDDESDPNGRFAWILDPEGSKIELWEPKRT